MDQNFDLQGYMTKGVEQVVMDAIKATLKNPRESAFMLRFAAASRAASKRRAELEKDLPAVWEILRKGTEAAVKEARSTLDDVRRSMRIDYFNDATLIGG